MKISADRVLTPTGFLENRTIHLENGRVAGVGPREAGDIVCAVAVPGLIDQHTHGGFGADVMETTPERMLEWLRFLAARGVTQVLAGVYTAPIKQMRAALETARQVMRLQRGGADGALLAGVHLEGPFISRRALGAMDAQSVLPPSVAEYCRLTQGYEDMIRLVTLAPEENADALIGYLTARGVRVQAGHTAATAEEGRHAFATGVGGVTHFFNASTPIHHRAPGILTAALLDDRAYCECICDLVHVHPDAIRLIYKCKGAERMIIVSDAVFTTGLPDGVYASQAETYYVKNGESRTRDGALAGGGAVLTQEARSLIRLGVPARDAFDMASRTPAEHLGLPGGKIAPGTRAEIVCMNAAYEAVCTVIGEKVYGGPAA